MSSCRHHHHPPHKKEDAATKEETVVPAPASSSSSHCCSGNEKSSHSHGHSHDHGHRHGHDHHNHGPPPPPPSPPDGHGHGHDHRHDRGHHHDRHHDESVEAKAECCSNNKNSNNSTSEGGVKATTLLVSTTLSPCSGGGDNNNHGHANHDDNGAAGTEGEKKTSTKCCAGIAPSSSSLGAGSNNHNNSNHSNHSGPPLCLAVIRENGTDLVVFDAAGIPKTFRYEGDVRTLCFSSHDNARAEHFLTPCFDDDGNHGGGPGPDSGGLGLGGGGGSSSAACFCGIGMPHLHAHVRSPDTCDNRSSHHSGSDDERIAALADQVLLPVDPIGSNASVAGTEHSETTSTATREEAKESSSSLLRFAVSDRMPKVCNSRQVKKQLGDQGLDVGGIRCHQRRIHPVQHDDHVDYLVHDSKAGSLHLAYPCDDCGMEDVHGTFTNVASRTVARKKRRGGGHHQDNEDSMEGDGVQLHFFQVDPTRPFSLVEHLQNLFQTHQSDRVSAATHLMGHGHVGHDHGHGHIDHIGHDHGHGGDSRMAPSVGMGVKPAPTRDVAVSVRSTFACTGICCSSETPVILRLLETIKGVHRVMVNVPVKQVLVDHDPSLVSTSELDLMLSKNGFKATTLTDGSASAAAAASAAATALTAENGRTVLFVEGICCASEVPTVKSILEPLKGVAGVSVNTTQKLVYVNHSLAYVSSQQLADALASEGFPSEIREDASRAVLSAQSAFVRSLLSLEMPDTDEGDPKTNDLEALTALLRRYDGTQVESFVVDWPARAVTVIHNPFVLSAQDVVTALRANANIESKVLTDGADPKTWSIPEWDEKGGAATSGADNLDADEKRSFPRPNVILSGVCWVISMLHYIGGNWYVHSLLVLDATSILATFSSQYNSHSC
jgi:copper chaperone CopZ